MDIHNVKRKTTSFLIGSFALLLVVSAGVFFSLGVYMSRVSKNAIDKVGSLYMTGINEQITSHFRTLMELKLEQAEAVVTVVSQDMDINALYGELIYRTNVRNFDYLALCTEDGEIEMLYGNQLRLADPEPFFTSLRNKQKKVAVGVDSKGNEAVMFGINAAYPMKSGGESMAIIVALPLEYISEMLATEGESELMYSNIIRQDGSFIVKNMKGDHADYFSNLYDRYQNDDKEKIDAYIQELTDAMAKGESYSAIQDFDGSRQQVYCTDLPYSEWHLVTILPFGMLNETVDGMSQNRTVATMASFAVILVVLMFIFVTYYKMTQQQLRDLNEARQDAMQATKAKSEFLSNMSHDIRTPMNAIVGMTAIATAHIDDKEQVQNCLRKIALSGKHLLGLINDVLDMSKIESGKMTLTAERVSLREVVEGIVSIVQTQVKAKGQSFNVHIDNITVEDVYCDSVRMNQVLSLIHI